MTPKEKATEIIDKFFEMEVSKTDGDFISGQRKLFLDEAKKCSEIAIKNEYFSLRELVVRLKPASGLSEKTYLQLIENLISEENEIISEIKNL